MIMKKQLSILIVIILILTMFIFPQNIYANESTQANFYSAEYVGKYDAETPMEFSIDRINIQDKTFTGKIKTNDGLVDINEQISGNIKLNESDFECSFGFKYRSWLTTYDAYFTLNIDPFKGSVTGNGGGGLLIFSENISLHGTVFEHYNKWLSYNENDMIMCMELSNIMYKEDIEINITEYLFSTINPKYFKINEDIPIIAYNYTNYKGEPDSDKNNSPFAIMSRINNDNSIDIIVSIRGTYNEEWEGNAELTGEAYDDKIDVHYSFDNAKNSLKERITDYYNNYCSNYKTVNLIITGHSRGAAVANLYAKEATDVAENNKNNDDANIPKFSSVTAYTFACPNVVKINSQNTVDYLESYTNINNFWFDTDIVPAVPLTSPTNGWNYWKFGSCYIMNLRSVYQNDVLKKYAKDNNVLYYNGFINTYINKEMQIAFLQWPTVKSYYTPFLLGFDPTRTESLYDFVKHLTIAKSTQKNVVLGICGLDEIIEHPQISPLFLFALNNVSTIFKSHSQNTYQEIISKYGSSEFFKYSYIDQVDNSILNEPSVFSNSNDIMYNLNELNILKQFASSGDNNEKLSWDLDNPQSWDGIEWDDEGHVKSIDFTYKWLTGELDCSAFSELEKLNLYANSLTGITLNNQKLISLNCSYNNLSQNEIDLSACTNLTELYCDGCSLSTLNLANNPELQTLSCSFNKLFALNIENNDKLSHISCPYNYLDVHEGGNLYNRFTELQSSNNTYVNYNPQMLTENAVIDTNELQALESFVKHNQNNEELNWLNDNGDIDINKVQNNVYFEFDGEKYKITAIDISNIYVQGDLDLSSFTELTSLYCDNTKITGLNVSNSTKLEDLVCENSEITSLILPVNSTQNSSKLSNIKCQNNHIDINIFTEEIIKNIESKDDYILEYKHQIIEKDISAFDESDYNLLVNFANQRNNNKILDWNLSTPGKWENVSWKFDNTSGKYKLLECHFDFMEVKGNIDVSGCDMLDEVSFSGSKINTVTISGKNLNDSTFYGCSELEAVIIKGGSTIYEGTFKMCPTLQAIYIPSNITEIADNAFENSSNITIAGVADSYAQTYANKHNINFKPGAFICGNIVAKENLDDSYQYYYPVEDVSIVYNDEVQSTSDKLGYFVLFSTESGENQYKLEYPYGYNINQMTSITNNEPLIIENPIGLICYDWRNDGYINAKDYLKLSDQIKRGSEATGIDDKYFDINKDGKVTEEDWELANNFLNYPNPNK